jgi:CubicO group peptidase (beta-lactamase class C family)
MTLRLFAAGFVSAAIVLTAPFMGQLRAAIRSAFHGQFVVIVGGFVALSLALAVLVAVRRIRERRALRHNEPIVILGLHFPWRVRTDAAVATPEDYDSRIPRGVMNIRQSLTLVTALLCLSSATGAQTAGKFDAVVEAMQRFVDRGEISGVVTLLATKDKVLHVAAVGSSDLATRRKMRTDDIFWIASMSKPITAVCLGILADAGKLGFDDPVEKYLPEFAAVTVTEESQRVKPARAITLRDVLTHTSGLAELERRDPHLTLEETSKRVVQTSLRFQPGTRWSYSTAGIDVMGRVVEVVSGMRFDQFLQKHVLDPLAMKDTSFWISPQKKSRWARSYRWVPEEKHLQETTISYLYGTEVTDHARPPLGGAGLFSTAGDVARFYQMLLNKGELHGHRILKPATVIEMTKKQTGDLRARPGMPWGLGVSVIDDPSAMEANAPLSPGSFGHGGAYSTQSWADPARNMVWIIMFQRTGKGNPDNSDVRIAFQAAAINQLF